MKYISVSPFHKIGNVFRIEKMIKLRLRYRNIIYYVCVSCGHV